MAHAMASRDEKVTAAALSAANYGRIMDVKILLDRENITLETKRAMANYAAAAGHGAIVEFLVEGGHLQPKKMVLRNGCPTSLIIRAVRSLFAARSQYLLAILQNLHHYTTHP